MDEREALKRQIALLQNLINDHKSVHGNAPFAREQHRRPEAPPSARDRGHSTYVAHPHSSRGGRYAPQSRGSWRKTYSLSNKNPQPSASTSSTVHQSSSLSREDSRGSTTAAPSSGTPQHKREGLATEKRNTETVRKTGAGVSQHEDTRGGTSVQHEALPRQTDDLQAGTGSRHVVLPGKTVIGSSEVPSSGVANTVSSLQSIPAAPIKATPTDKTSTAHCSKPTIPTTTDNTIPPLLAPSNVSTQPSLKPTSHSQGRVSASLLKKSKFTWVKSQNVGGVKPKQASSISSPTGKAVTAASTSVSKAGVAPGSSLFITIKRTPAKKLPRKLSSVHVAPKTSKYKWVSSSAGAQAKTPRKSLSPKPPTLSQKALEKGDATKKLRAASTSSASKKKGIVGSSPSSSLSSRYRWKAGGQSTSVAVAGGATGARRRSAFHWTSEKSSKGAKGGIVVSPSVTQRPYLMPSSSPGSFKLRSRMKIIRKSASSGGASEKGTSPPSVRYSPRSRIYNLTRSPIGARRTPSRELVSFGRHKLRRLSPTSSRTGAASSSHRGPAPSHRSPASSQRVFRSRYKMVTRSSTAHPFPHSPALSWRAKRIQSARSFLQNRMRAPHDRHPSSSPPWRGSSMCWIRGSLYRVSANKLSRTVASNMSINRTGRSFSSGQVSSTSPASNRPSSSRHLASRAVQRSLAIIRHARQKKPQKQYCMYYNRFGKCNRGNSCPYIHDPDKVAVCTRFLRGTCKQENGTCPFSHKVAKEKMPVCSYFLKGICNNSDCPYSHVYVSRKAEVCEDFVKGYCPEGEKCKKKHTLVCPDFTKTGSCPRGARCKLQHRQPAKQSASNTSTTPPAKKTRTKESTKRPHLSVVMPQAPQGAPRTPTKGPLALPSFISLSSSPEEADAPYALPAETAQVKEKRLQIKPRL